MSEQNVAMEIYRSAKRLGIPQNAPEVIEAKRVAVEAVRNGYTVEEAHDFVRRDLQRAAGDREYALN